jgi:hypothetical protein
MLGVRGEYHIHADVDGRELTRVVVDQFGRQMA